MIRILIQRRAIAPYTRSVYLAAVLVLAAVQLAAALPVVSEITVIGGDRGVAVSFSADAPFSAEFSGNDKMLVARLTACVYGLPEFNYSNFPANSPLRSITAVEKKNASVEITISSKQGINLPIKSVQKKSQWIVLLTGQPVQPFTWNTAHTTPHTSSTPPAVAPVRAPAGATAGASVGASAGATVNAQSGMEPTHQGHLQSIRLLQRGLICELAFEFDADVSSSIQRKGPTVTIRVENVQNGIGGKQLTIPENTPFKSVSIQEKRLNETAVLDAKVTIDTTRIESNFNIAFTRGTVLSLFLMQRNEQKATLWTSGHGVAWNYQFYNVPSYEVDMQSIGNRARRDATQQLSKEKTFAIKEPPTMEPEIAAAPAPSPPAPVEVPAPAVETASAPEKATNGSPTMIVNSTNVNIRSSPSLKGRIVGKVVQGDTVAVIEKTDQWYKVDAHGSTGYVYASLLRSNDMPGTTSTEAEAVALQNRNETPTPPQEVAESITRVSSIGAAAASSTDTSAATPSIPGSDDKELISNAQSSRNRVIRYQGVGRDPFRPIVNSSISTSGLPFVENLNLVGVLFDDDAHIALCEDSRNDNRPFAFREHDPVEKGKVLKIYQDKVVFLITEYGISRSFTLGLSQASREQEAGKQ